MEPGVWQIVIVIAIIVLFFGAKKIPELAKGIGQGMTEFKKATNLNSDQQVEDNRENEVHEQESNTTDSQKAQKKTKAE
jgi:sec-independent protein translocase protein TatA